MNGSEIEKVLRVKIYEFAFHCLQMSANG